MKISVGHLNPSVSFDGVQHLESLGLWGLSCKLNNYKIQHFENRSISVFRYRSSFRNVVFYSYLEFRSIETCINPLILTYHTAYRFRLVKLWSHVRFEVFSALTMKNGVFWVVTPCGSCKNRCFGGTWRLLHQSDKNRWTRNNTSCN
jgi:hypothetical protein